MSMNAMFALIALGAAGGTPDCMPNWDTAIGDGAANGSVVDIEAFDFGAGPEIYCTGDFTTLDGVTGLNRIARWDGTQWNPLGTGLSSQFSNAIAQFQGDIYVGGYFDSAGGAADSAKLARWDVDNNDWSGLGANLSLFTNSLWALQTWDDGNGEDLYIGGNYMDIGGAGGPDFIARWDGTQFTEVGGTIAGAGIPLIVLDIAVFQGDLYIGGRFASVDGVPASHIARWDGTQWHDVAGGITGLQVIDLTVADDGSGPALFVGGSFNTAGAVPAANVAKWDGSTWSALGGGTDATVQTIAGFDDGSGPKIFVGGNFDFIDGDDITGMPANRMGRWNGAEWSTVGGGADGNVFDMFPFQGRLNIGGGFTRVDGMTVAGAIQLLDCGAAGNPADLNGDGVVNSDDLAQLLGSWGPCPAMGPCDADLNGDGVVNSDDLAQMLGSWG